MSEEATVGASVGNGNGAGEGFSDSGPSSAAEGPAECIVHRIVPNALGGVWQSVKPMLRESVRWSEITSRLETINDVEQKVHEGIYQLWCVFRGGEVIGAVLTCITEKSRCSILDVVYGAGDDLKDWMDLLYQTLDEEAVEKDCRFIRIEGRPGWKEPLGKLGFKHAYDTFMRDV